MQGDDRTPYERAEEALALPARAEEALAFPARLCHDESMTFRAHFHSTKAARREFRVVLRLSEDTSLDQRLSFRTRREADTAARHLQREMDQLNAARAAERSAN